MSNDQSIDVTVAVHNNAAAGANAAADTLKNAADRMRRDLGGLGTAAKDSMQQMQDSVKTSVAGMAGHFGGLVTAIGQVKGGFVALSGILAAFALSKTADATERMTESAMDLSRALGVSTGEASIWQTALADVGATESELTSASAGMTRQIKKNEEAMQALGLKTRDAAGSLRPMSDLMIEGIAIVNEYAPGIDRQTTAMELFGRGADASSKLMLTNREVMERARESAKEFGLEIGDRSKAAWEASDAARDKLGYGFQGLTKVLGDAVLPAFTDLREMLGSAMPVVILVTKGAIGGLLTAFYVLRDGAFDVAEGVIAAFRTVASFVGDLASGIWKALTGDKAGADEAIANMGKRMSAIWEESLSKMTARAIETRSRIAALFAQGDPASKPSGGKRRGAGGAIGASEASGGEEADGRTRAFDAIQANNEAIQKEGEKRAKYTVKNNKDAEDATKKSSDEIFRTSDIARKNNQDAALAGLDEAQRAAEFENEIGRTSADEFLQTRKNYLDAREQLEIADINGRLDLALTDPTNSPELIQQLEGQKEAIYRDYSQRRIEISRNETRETMTMWSDLQSRMSSLWDQGINAMINGTLTWDNAIRGIGKQMVTWFITDVVGKPVKAWLLGETTKTGATQTGVLVRVAAETWAAIKSVAIWAATAAKNILTAAWSAMAAAWASISAIPVVGPALAPIVAAGTFAGVVALAGKVASARGGYDIPAGVNPLTQLHEKEMVLPARQADVIRDMADGGGGGGGNVSVTIQALDGESVRRVLMSNKSALADALKSAIKDGKR